MAKIHKEAIEYVKQVILSKDLDLPTILKLEYLDKGLTTTRFIWDLHRFVESLVKASGEYTCLFAGEDDQTSWKGGAKYLYPGEVKDTHIETAMRSAATQLGCTL